MSNNYFCSWGRRQGQALESCPLSEWILSIDLHPRSEGPLPTCSPSTPTPPTHPSISQPLASNFSLTQVSAQFLGFSCPADLRAKSRRDLNESDPGQRAMVRSITLEWDELAPFQLHFSTFGGQGEVSFPRLPGGPSPQEGGP